MPVIVEMVEVRVPKVWLNNESDEQKRSDEYAMRAMAAGRLMVKNAKTGKIEPETEFKAISRADLVIQKDSQGHHYPGMVGGVVTRKEAQLEFGEDGKAGLGTTLAESTSVGYNEGKLPKTATAERLDNVA